VGNVDEMADLRICIKAPIPEIFDAWHLLNQAVDAHLAGDIDRAKSCFRDANSRAVWEWLNPDWERPHLLVRFKKPTGDTKVVPVDRRDKLRHPTKEIQSKALGRDGYRCRCCGIPVISADIRMLAHRLYSDVVPWSRDPACQHAAFACMWLQFDHVVPHSHGGCSCLENIVVTCALCNYGKDRYTLAQLGLSDPRQRQPETCSWDGLERFRRAIPDRSAGA
jgi:5-methylcytosine-specific restriction endonuclease McrA